ncbi:MAG TPA: hypothetical protein VFI20_07015 [Terracidiphilus sp.]|nr:hypothetical protein [Terracidiphilus sp.]
MSPETETPAHVQDEACGSTMQVIGWFSAGMAVAALSIMVGRELRSRYKFSHRTPYDFYSSAGERSTSEFGMGI